MLMYLLQCKCKYMLFYQDDVIHKSVEERENIVERQIYSEEEEEEKAERLKCTAGKKFLLFLFYFAFFF